MQPNNQNPYQQGQNPSPSNAPPQVTGYAGANVPEYLHLDPVTQSAASSKKKIMLFAVIVTVFLTIGIGVTVYLFWEQGASERLFYRSLENAMKTDFLKKKYVIEATNPTMKLSMDVETDLSNPAAPKSLIHQEYSVEYSGAAKKVVKGSEIAWSDQTYYSFIDTTTTNAKSSGAQPGIWYEYSDARTDSAESSATSLADVDKRQDINSPNGVIIQGDFNETQRSSLLEYINQHDVYIIDSVEAQPGTTKYIIKVDYEALNNLNKELSKLMGDNRLHPLLRPLSDGDEMISLIVDNKTQKIERLLYQAKNTRAGSDFMRSVSFEYPLQLIIEKPANFKKATK